MGEGAEKQSIFDPQVVKIIGELIVIELPTSGDGV